MGRMNNSNILSNGDKSRAKVVVEKAGRKQSNDLEEMSIWFESELNFGSRKNGRAKLNESKS